MFVRLPTAIIKNIYTEILKSIKHKLKWNSKKCLSNPRKAGEKGNRQDKGKKYKTKIQCRIFEP